MCQSGLRGKRRLFGVDMDFFGTQSGSDDGDELYVFMNDEWLSEGVPEGLTCCVAVSCMILSSEEMWTL